MLKEKYKKLALLVAASLASCTMMTACNGSSGGSGSSTSDIDFSTFQPQIKNTIPDEPTGDKVLPTQTSNVLTVKFVNFSKDNETLLKDYNIYNWAEGCDGSVVTDPVNTDWGNATVTPDRIDEYGAEWDLPIGNSDGNTACVIIRTNANGDKATGTFEKFTPVKFEDGDGAYILLVKDSDQVKDKTIAELYDEYKANATLFDIDGASAWWVTEDTFVMFPEEADVAQMRLYIAKDNASLIAPDETNTISDQFINLEKAEISQEIKDKYPLFATEGAVAYKIPDGADFDAKEGVQAFSKDILKKETAILGLGNDGAINYASRIKNAKLIDTLYSEEATKLSYGANVGESGTEFRVWAPTAQKVELVKFTPKADDSTTFDEDVLELAFDEASGAWSTTTDKLQHGDYYKYRVTVYRPYNRTIESKDITDPYSMGLSTDSKYSIVVDFSKLENKVTVGPHAQKEPSDIANMMIIESHIRDMTIYDRSVAEENRGKYLGVIDKNGEAYDHLKSLADAGATHLEILPFYDIASIVEDRDPTKNKYLADLSMSGADFCAQRKIDVDDQFAKIGLCDATTLQAFVEELAATDLTTEPTDDGTGKLIPGSTLVSTFLNYIKNDDSFNWGYDPWHYGAPEGSYSSNPEGLTRNEELRQMINGIHEDIGMNVIMDVVYNHTDGASGAKSSVLDEIVPWYYNRYNATSATPTGETCCQDSASEHKMFAKLMKDTLVSWVKNYGVDAFRFDLMGYIPRSVMQETLVAVRKESEREDVYFLGEGWDPGSNATASIGSTETATQINLPGFGIGTFNDRLRDAIRGNGPFDHGNNLLHLQGFATGRCSDVNYWRKQVESDYNCEPDTVNETDFGMHGLHWQDIIRVTMAGALRDFQITTYTGEPKTGEGLSYWGPATGYTDNPYESINYVSKHDNQAVFDMIMYKSNSPATLEGLKKKARQQAIAVATVILGQTPAFDYQGSDLLRSKSFENDSYNSGDWVNGIRYIKDGDDLTNGFSLGYTNKDKDSEDWSPISYARQIDNTTTKMGNIDAKDTGVRAIMHGYYTELLSIRKDFKNYISLGTKEKIMDLVSFPDAGKDQTPGVIVMKIVNPAVATNYLTVVINARNDVFDATKYNVEGELVANQADKAANSIAASEDGTLSTIDMVQPWSVAVFEKK